MTTKNDVWDQIKKDFKIEIPKSEFKTWLSQASLKEIDANQAVIEVPNKFVAHWLQDNYTDQIQTILRNNLNTLPKIHFTYVGLSSHDDALRKETVKTEDANIHHGINTVSTFSDFITADSNRLAYSSALNVVSSPADNYNPLYIFSELSLGKTHLLNAIGNLVLKNDPSVNVMYLPAERFIADFSFTSDNQNPDRFWERDDSPDFLLLDDIHLLSDHRELQAELLGLCNSFLESAKQLVVASTYPPGKIPNLIPQLRSRLEWGLIAEVYPPGQRTKMKIIKKRAKQENLALADDVVFFLANSTDDIDTLIRYIFRLKSYASSHRRRIGISEAESIIKKKVYPANYADLTHIQKVTAKYFNISLTDLLSNKKGKMFSYPRQVAIYLSKNLTSLSLQEIGNAFGNKHHSTVIYSEKRIRKTKLHNKKVLNDINKLQKLLF